MTTFEVIKTAIQNKKKISFEYTKDPATSDTRYGDPHVVFLNKTTNLPTLDLYQTSGDCSDKSKLPCWRPFILDNIQNIKILDEGFEIAEWYISNPESWKYSKPLFKIQ